MKILERSAAAHDLVAAVVVQWSPLIAPLPNALVVYHALTPSMGVLASVATAATVELIGFAMGSILLQAVNMRAGRMLVSVAGFGLALYLVTAGLVVWQLPHGTYPEAVRMLPMFSALGALAVGADRQLRTMQTAHVDARRIEIDLADYEERLRIERRALSRQKMGQNGTG